MGFFGCFLLFLVVVIVLYVSSFVCLFGVGFLCCLPCKAFETDSQEIIQTCKDEPIPHLSHIKEAYVALTRLNNDNAEQTEVSKTRVMILNLLDRIDIATFPV
jgi:hypothetical protein